MTLPNIFQQIGKFAKSGNTRTAKVKKNVMMSSVVMVFSNLNSFLLVPIAIGFVSPLRYGVWLTVLSFVNWFNLFDLGLGNGLKNRLGEALAQNRMDDAKELVSTAYVVIAIISILLILLSMAIFPLISWDRVFNAPKEITQELNSLMRVVFVLFSVRFTLQLINPILAAFQKTALTQLNNFIGTTLSLVTIFILTKTINGSLFILGLTYMIFPVLVYAAVSIFWFSRTFSNIRPSLFKFRKKHLGSIMNLGIMFLINQVAVIVLSTSSNMLISHISGPASVTPYAITHRFFFLIVTIYAMFTAPLWPAFTEAYAKKDYLWIKKVVSAFNKCWLYSCGILLLMLGISPILFRLWIGDKVTIPFTLSALMALSVALTTYVHVYSSFLCGTGKIRLATYTSLIFSILYIPLGVLLAKYLHLGFHGIVIATIIVTLPNLYTHTTQYKKLVTETATGIWNK